MTKSKHSKPCKISVIGDGGWGTTLAIHLSGLKYDVRLWGAFPPYIKEMKKRGTNFRFLPGIKLPKALTLSDDLKESLEFCDLIVFAAPSKYTPSVLKQIKATNVRLSNKLFLSVTKGIDTSRLIRMSQIIEQELPKPLKLAVLSGPTIAKEVALKVPSTAVIASKNRNTAKKIQSIVNSPHFRIYTNNDVVGVEVGGSIKNIIAIACGICDGLKLGTNTKAAILTRGLAEMARLGKVLGAKPQTFAGLTGLGDLATTCYSLSSRNRCLGEQIGQGKSAKKILASMHMVAEGAETVKAAYKLSLKHKIDMPITAEIYKIIYKNKKAKKAVLDLMNRKVRSE